jgi:hypothetical protein
MDSLPKEEVTASLDTDLRWYDGCAGSPLEGLATIDGESY